MSLCFGGCAALGITEAKHCRAWGSMPRDIILSRILALVVGGVVRQEPSYASARSGIDCHDNVFLLEHAWFRSLGKTVDCSSKKYWAFRASVRFISAQAICIFGKQVEGFFGKAFIDPYLAHLASVGLAFTRTRERR